VKMLKTVFVLVVFGDFQPIQVPDVLRLLSVHRITCTAQQPVNMQVTIAIVTAGREVYSRPWEGFCQAVQKKSFFVEKTEGYR